MALKFAFLGTWHSHAPMHVETAARYPDQFELLGMYDPNAEVIAANQERFARYQLPVPIIPSVEAVLDSAAEAVVIEGHVHQNLDYAEQALKAGKHVLLEKPAGVDLDHLERVHALARDSGLALQMAYMWRYNPALFELLRLVRRGFLGQVFQYRGHIPKPLEWHKSLAGEFSQYTGGVYFEMAGHMIDLMVTLMGEPETVQTVMARHWGERADDGAFTLRVTDRRAGSGDDDLGQQPYYYGAADDYYTNDGVYYGAADDYGTADGEDCPGFTYDKCYSLVDRPLCVAALQNRFEHWAEEYGDR